MTEDPYGEWKEAYHDIPEAYLVKNPYWEKHNFDIAVITYLPQNPFPEIEGHPRVWIGDTILPVPLRASGNEGIERLDLIEVAGYPNPIHGNPCGEFVWDCDCTLPEGEYEATPDPASNIFITYHYCDTEDGNSGSPLLANPGVNQPAEVTGVQTNRFRRTCGDGYLPCFANEGVFLHKTGIYPFVASNLNRYRGFLMSRLNYMCFGFDRLSMEIRVEPCTRSTSQKWFYRCWEDKNGMQIRNEEQSDQCIYWDQGDDKVKLYQCSHDDTSEDYRRQRFIWVKTHYTEWGRLQFKEYPGWCLKLDGSTNVIVARDNCGGYGLDEKFIAPERFGEMRLC